MNKITSHLFYKRIDDDAFYTCANITVTIAKDKKIYQREILLQI